MTTATDIVNWALMVPGTRTTVTDAELAGNLTNEAIQANLKIDSVRRRLLRMAPWNCALKTANLVYITSTTGTPENTSPEPFLWGPGQPSPPWNYEYQYPVDCLRACMVIPATQVGFAGDFWGHGSSFWQSPAVKFKVQTDTFASVNAATVVVGGSGYSLGDLLQGPGALISGTAPFPGTAPVGGPVLLQVTAVNAGAITTLAVLPQVRNTNTSPLYAGVAQGPLIGGSYFAALPNPVQVSSLTGSGTGALIALYYGSSAPQRVILCNQEFAICSYIQDITDPDLMDDQFRDTWARALGAELTIPLTGDKKLANLAVQDVNNALTAARVGDGNEGFTVNDITPDWIRIRGIDFASPYSGPFSGFDWGGMYPLFG